MIQIVVLSCFFSLALADVKDQISGTSSPQQEKNKAVSVKEEKNTQDKLIEKEFLDEELIEENFVPSLSESVHQTHRRKRQLAHKLNNNVPKASKPSKNEGEDSKSTTVVGNLEVSVSQRNEEDVSKARGKKKK